VIFLKVRLGFYQDWGDGAAYTALQINIQALLWPIARKAFGCANFVASFRDFLTGHRLTQITQIGGREPFNVSVHHRLMATVY